MEERLNARSAPSPPKPCTEGPSKVWPGSEKIGRLELGLSSVWPSARRIRSGGSRVGKQSLRCSIHELLISWRILNRKIGEFGKRVEWTSPRSSRSSPLRDFLHRCGLERVVHRFGGETQAGNWRDEVPRVRIREAMLSASTELGPPNDGKCITASTPCPAAAPRALRRARAR